MKFKSGDILRILPYNKIKSTLSHTDRLDGLYYHLDMKEYSGKWAEAHFSSIRGKGYQWRLKGNDWWWHEKWLESGEFFSDNDFEIS